MNPGVIQGKKKHNSENQMKSLDRENYTGIVILVCIKSWIVQDIEFIIYPSKSDSISLRKVQSQKLPILI
jgi:hypothetical protein